MLALAEARAVVAVHTRVDKPETIHPNDAAGGHTVLALNTLGVAVAYIAGGGQGAYRETDSGLLVRAHEAIWVPEREKVALDLETSHELLIAKGGLVTAMRCRFMAHLPANADQRVPIVNGPAAVALDSKLAQRRLSAPNMAPGFGIPPEGAISTDELANLSTDDIWIKSARGLSSKGSRRTTRAEAQATLAELRAERSPDTRDPGWVVEAHDPGLPIRGLKASVPELQRFIDNASPGDNHEIRMFCFANTLNRELNVHIVPVFRFCAGSENNTWIPIDPATVPAKAFEVSQAAAQVVLQESGYKGAHVAVDVYGSRDGSIKVREWNIRDPGVGSWLVSKARLLTEQERSSAAPILNEVHGNGFGALLATLALATYNKRTC